MYIYTLFSLVRQTFTGINILQKFTMESIICQKNMTKAILFVIHQFMLAEKFKNYLLGLPMMAKYDYWCRKLIILVINAGTKKLKQNKIIR